MPPMCSRLISYLLRNDLEIGCSTPQALNQRALNSEYSVQIENEKREHRHGAHSKTSASSCLLRPDLCAFKKGLVRTGRWLKTGHLIRERCVTGAWSDACGKIATIQARSLRATFLLAEDPASFFWAVAESLSSKCDVDISHPKS